MAWTTLKGAIDAIFTTNGSNQITGLQTRTIINQIVDEVGQIQFKGKATPSTNPGSYDGERMYMTTEAGTYTDFDDVVVVDGKLTVLINTGGTWSKIEFDLPSGGASSDWETGSESDTIKPLDSSPKVEITDLQVDKLRLFNGGEGTTGQIAKVMSDGNMGFYDESVGILAFTNYASFPTSGFSSTTIYYDISTKTPYRWANVGGYMEIVDKYGRLSVIANLPATGIIGYTYYVLNDGFYYWTGSVFEAMPVGGGGSGEDNVQSNFNETDENSDSFIINKPLSVEENKNEVAFFETFAKPIYKLVDDSILAVDGNRLMITTVDAANNRFRFNRAANTFNLEKSIDGEKWVYCNAFPPDSSIAANVGHIEYVDYVNDWFYYSEFKGGTPTTGLTELLNPYVNFSIVGDGMLFPQLKQGLSFNGNTMKNHHMGGVIQKDDGTYLCTVWTRYTNNNFENWFATSQNGYDWELGASPFIANNAISGETILFVTSLFKIPNNAKNHAGKIMVFLRMSTTSTGKPGYVILNDDLTFATTPKLMTFDSANTIGLTNLGNCTLTYYNNQYRLLGLDVKPALTDRTTTEIIFDGDLIDFIDGTGPPLSFQTLFTQDQFNSNDWEHGVKNNQHYVIDGGELYIMMTNTSYGESSTNRNYGDNFIMKYNDINNSWGVYKTPIFWAGNDQRRFFDTKYTDRDNGSTICQPYKIGSKLMLMIVCKKQIADGYSIHLAEYRRDARGFKTVEHDKGRNVPIDGSSQDVYFNKPFTYEPAVTVTPIASTPIVPTIVSVDKYKFTVKFYDSSGSSVTSGNFNFIAESL